MATENPLDVFTRSLTSARSAANLSLPKLGKLSGVHYSAICEFEHGRRIPTYQAVVKIATALRAPGLVPLAEQLIVWNWKHKETGPDVDLEEP